MRFLKIIFLSTSLLRNNIPVLGGPARLHLPTLAGPIWLCMSTAKTVRAIVNLFMTAQRFVFKQVFRMSQVVEVSGRDVGIPILFLLRILSRESKTRTLNSTSMIDFVCLFLLCHHVCELLDDTINHVCESRSWNFRVLNIWRLNSPPFVLKICCFILVDEYYYHCWRVVPVSFESNPT